MPFPGFQSKTLLSHTPPTASMRVRPHTPTDAGPHWHSLKRGLQAFIEPRAYPSIEVQQAILCYTHGWRLVSLHVYYLVGGDIPGVSGWLIWLFFLRVQNPFAPSVLSLSLLLETLCSVQSVAAIAHSCQQVLPGFLYRIWVWCLNVGWIPNCGSLKMTFLQSLLHTLSPYVLSLLLSSCLISFFTDMNFLS